MKHDKKQKFAEMNGNKETNKKVKFVEDDEADMEVERDSDRRHQPDMLTENDLINENKDLEFEDDYDDEWEDEKIEKSESADSSDYVTDSEDEQIDNEISENNPQQKQKRVKLKQKPKQKSKLTPFTGT